MVEAWYNKNRLGNAKSCINCTILVLVVLDPWLDGIFYCDLIKKECNCSMEQARLDVDRNDLVCGRWEGKINGR